MRSIEEIREAASRLHTTAWYGRKEARAVASPEDAAKRCARFSIPRQPDDDDEIVYAAIDELERLRKIPGIHLQAAQPSSNTDGEKQ